MSKAIETWGDLIKKDGTTNRDLAAFILNNLQGYRTNVQRAKRAEDLNDLECYLHSYHFHASNENPKSLNNKFNK